MSQRSMERSQAGFPICVITQDFLFEIDLQDQLGESEGMEDLLTGKLIRVSQEFMVPSTVPSTQTTDLKACFLLHPMLMQEPFQEFEHEFDPMSPSSWEFLLLNPQRTQED